MSRATCPVCDATGSRDEILAHVRGSHPGFRLPDARIVFLRRAAAALALVLVVLFLVALWSHRCTVACQ